MKNVELVFDSKNKYWYCSGCGAVYRYPENWNPPASYCMRCRREWTEAIDKNEKD